MKNVFMILSSLALLLSLQVYVFAEPASKEVPAQLTASANDVTIGETVHLTATSVKHGSSYEVIWSGAEDKGTLLDTSLCTYVSAAVFTAEKPGIYTVEYKIVMSAGKSNRRFIGTAVQTINVTAPITVTGAEIRIASLRKITRPDGSVSLYSAAGDIFTVWNDNSKTYYGRIFFFYGPNEVSKNIDVTLNIEGKVYKYTVAVARENY